MSGAFAGAHASPKRRQAAFPGTVGPKEGNGAAIAGATSAAKIAALHIVLTRRECTVGLTSAWYARLFLDEKKIFWLGRHQRRRAGWLLPGTS
jgi:hypothetical protein